MYRILIVEDDETLVGVLRRQLEKWGYAVTAASDFGGVLEQFLQESPHLVLLDVSLPYFDGYYWCQQIRKVSQAPILFITSQGDPMSLVMAVQMGADDLVAKPFRLEVVTAKIQALLRRSYAFGADKNVLEAGGVLLDLGEAALSFQDKRLDLTKNELRVLQLLMERRGNAVSRETLMQRLWDTESFVDDNTLTVCMARLRKKLAGVGLENWIKTKKGVGYLVEHG